MTLITKNQYCVNFHAIGYDMEDAMIINKSSYERGFAYGTIYKANFIDLKEISTGRKNRGKFEKDSVSDLIFDRDPKRLELSKFLDADGLPYPGTRLQEGDPYYCYRNDAEGGVYTIKKYESKEMAYVDTVKFCGNDFGSSGKERACISLRIPRAASVGDKFASRAGQKGTIRICYSILELF